MEKEQIEIIPAESDKEIQNSYGKFKNAEELYKAYNALEGEFTKRSQKLKQLEKTSKPEILDPPTATWEDKVTKFMSDYPIAGNFAKDLANTVATDEKYVKNDNGLEKALVDVLSGKIKSKQDMAIDQEIVEMVLKSDDNKKKVIDDYINSLSTPNLPKILPVAGGAIPCSESKPSNFSDASKLAQKYLEQK
ncbi:MAG: hypothetical protein WCR54_03990 [Clostridia bacterium]